MNTENDNTAIWLEHKFDVPSSGEWVSENVVSIPAFKKPKSKGSPGLIVFERTPLEGVDDEIERCVIIHDLVHFEADLVNRKYRVIDDCARLRDILDSLPPEDERHYTPCLLVIGWSEKDDSDNLRDLVDMVQLSSSFDRILRLLTSYSV